MTNTGALKLALASLVIALLVAGCGGAKEQYYRLSASGPAPLKASGLAVGVGPITLPTYIDRAELVFQSDANRFDVPAKTRWAGLLQENFGQVLATDIGRHINSGNVVANPQPGDTNLRYRVSVVVRQFHSISGQGAILDATWRVEDAASRQVLRHANVNLRSPINGDGYEAVVAAESDLIDQLAASISHAL